MTNKNIGCGEISSHPYKEKDIVAEIEKDLGFRITDNIDKLSNTDMLDILLTSAKHFASEKSDSIKRNDTYHGILWDNFLNILKSKDFIIDRVNPYQRDDGEKLVNEIEIICYRDDGLIIYANTFTSGKSTSVNRAVMMFEIKIPIENLKDMVPCTRCSYDSNDTDAWFTCEIDIRKDFICKLDSFENIGEFIPVWKYGNTMTSFVRNDEFKKCKSICGIKAYEYQEMIDKITYDKLNSCSENFKKIIKYGFFIQDYERSLKEK